MAPNEKAVWCTLSDSCRVARPGGGSGFVAVFGSLYVSGIKDGPDEGTMQVTGKHECQ